MAAIASSVEEEGAGRCGPSGGLGGKVDGTCGEIGPIEEHRAQFQADYSLVSGSKYRNAGSDGNDLGVIWAGGAPGESSTPGKTPPPPPGNLHIVIR